MKMNDKLPAHIDKYFHYYLFLTILITVSPFGQLSGNEEMYYGLAKKFLSPEWNGEYSAFISSGNYRFLSDAIIGIMLETFGFKNTQIIGSVFTSLILTHSIKKLCVTLEVDNTYGLLSVVAFILFGQSFIGREWLFEDFEAKVFAYYFVILAINQYVKHNSMQMVLLLSAATYFHLLVGVAWLGLLVLAGFMHDRNIRILLKDLTVYTLISIPIIFLALSGFLGAEYVHDSSLPSPSYIYSYIRQYKMVLPFYSLPSFVVSWLPGIAIFFGILAGISVSKIQKESNLVRRLKTLIVTSIVVIFIFLILSFFDTTGAFGKFYPYRFTSLLLLLLLLYFGKNLKNGDMGSDTNLGLMLIAAIAPFFVINGLTNALLEIRAEYEINPDRIELFQYLSDTTASNDLILVDPYLEEEMFDLERELNRPTLVSFKYIPSSKEGLIEWYKRRQFKSNLFLNLKHTGTDYSYDYLITGDQKTTERLKSTHSIIFRNDDYSVLTAI